MVIVIVKHKIAEDKKQAFERWAKEISQTARRYSGYLGTAIMRPLTEDDHDYACVIEFESPQHLEKWMASDDRNSFIRELADIGASKPIFQQYSSLEFWFEAKTGISKPPSRHKMALVSFFSIWALVHFVMHNIQPLIPGPSLFREMVVVVIIVSLMTYAVTPLLIRLLSNWLYK